MNEEQVSNPGRRSFCKACIGAMSAASCAMVAYPVIGFLKRPESLNAAKPVEIPLASLSAGQAQYAEQSGQQLIILLGPEGPRVFSASCPHLGCSVMWNSAEGIFRCPCHGAMFNAAGEVIRGPVSGSLTKIPFEIKDGKVIVS